MRFLVFGAGAIGSLVAARLAQAHEVSLVGRPDHVEAIRKHGLRVSGHTELLQSNLTAVTGVENLSGPPPDAVLLTVKAYDTAAAVKALAPFHDASMFVSLQNGLGNEEIIARRAPKVLGAVINLGAVFLGPGDVFHTGSAGIDLGPFAGTDANDAAIVAEAFQETGLKGHAVPNVGEKIWAKVILNAAVNPLTALLGLRTGELLGNEPLENALRLVVEESVAIAAACGVSIEAEDVLGTIRVIAEATRDNKSSMLQDLQRGRHTEIDAINGALIARAREHGMPCPANQLLASMVRAAESPAELDLRRSAEKFTSTFRPQGAASAYELLFVPVDGDSGFAPSVTEVRRCTQGWASLLEQIEGPEDLAEANWIEAAELTLAYLVCAGRAGINPEPDEEFQRIVTLTRYLEAELKTAGDGTEGSGGDTVERLSAVVDEIVAQGLAAEPGT